MTFTSLGSKLRIMSEEQATPAVEPISKFDFYFNTPLYETVPYSLYEDDLFTGVVDGYNHFAGADTTFTISSRRVDSYGNLIEYRVVTLECKRYNTTFEYFVYDVVRNSARLITKVGQLPSLADISSTEAEIKYSKKVNKEHLKFFKKAIGLASHGAGAGSFVYLRKIFEDIIYGSYQIHKSELKITDDEFKNKKMTDKINFLSSFLPPEMSAFKSLYPILSNGVHSMTEDECKRYFPALKLAIEVIWDNEIERREKELRARVVATQLETINKEIKGS